MAVAGPNNVSRSSIIPTPVIKDSAGGQVLFINNSIGTHREPSSQFTALPSLFFRSCLTVPSRHLDEFTETFRANLIHTQLQARSNSDLAGASIA